ncbi:DUF5412 domain-containing protein [Paenibacillus sp. 7541]|uniref:DUF5412 domain-containing protein n=1 Tax=Paenibacillus sp. 7541 TaxID=2026236 RepID=UPI000BA6A086|nr:DUF5412 domain-containing protein [Paenibacillus sp. 7541]PAK47796.1 hypothetical protein CHH75_23885 [Paenibacillus sp. 7541]
MIKKRWGLRITILLVITIAIYFYLSTFTLLLLPKGDLIMSSDSPNNKFTFNAYLVNAGGATGAFAVRGELINNLNGKTKNIYWEYRVEEAYVEWMDESTILVNGRKLDVNTDKYDFREHRN